MRKVAAKTVISQYAASPTIRQLIDSLNQWIDPRTDFEAFYENIFNIETAVGYGLDLWGRIVGINRVLSLATGSYFGFGEAGDRTGFNQSPFYTTPITQNFTLTDEAYRNLIFAKAAQNITDNSIPAINTILRHLFVGRGNAYVTDGRNLPFGSFFGFGEAGDRTGFNQSPFGDLMPPLPNNMTMVYVFKFALHPFELAMALSGVLPKPTGVLASVSYQGIA